MKRTLRVTRSWMFTMMALASVPFMTQAPTAEEVKATKEESLKTCP